MARPTAAWRVDQPTNSEEPVLFFIKLDCGCTYRVELEMMDQLDYPCPTHEERRFFGTDDFQIINDVQLPSPLIPPPDEEGDEWVGEPH